MFPPFFRKSTAVILLCAMMATSGCSYISHATDKITGTAERTVPDTGMVPLGGKRAPVLNPGGAMYSANADLESQKLAAENPYLNEGMRSTSNTASSAQLTQNAGGQDQQSGGWMGNVFHGSGAASASARRMPGENQSMMEQPPTMMAVNCSCFLMTRTCSATR